MKIKSKYLIIGIIIGILLTSITPVIAENVDVLFNSVGIKINGANIANIGDNYTLPNGKQVPFSISYADTTYLPIRKVGEILGLKIDYDNLTKTALLGENNININNKDNSSITYEEFKNMWKITIEELSSRKKLTVMYKGDMLIDDFINFWNNLDKELISKYGTMFYTEYAKIFPDSNDYEIVMYYYYDIHHLARGQYNGTTPSTSFFEIKSNPFWQYLK